MRILPLLILLISFHGFALQAGAIAKSPAPQKNGRGYLRETDQGPLLLIEGKVFPISGAAFSPWQTDSAISTAFRNVQIVAGADRIFLHLWENSLANPETMGLRNHIWMSHTIEGDGIACQRTPLSRDQYFQIDPVDPAAEIDQASFRCHFRQFDDRVFGPGSGTTMALPYGTPRARFTVTNGSSSRETISEKENLLNQSLIKTYFPEVLPNLSGGPSVRPPPPSHLPPGLMGQ